MQPSPNLCTKTLLCGLMAIGTLSSCSLPPRQAWQQIRQDGLIPFIANGLSAPRAQSSFTPSRPLLAGTNTSPVIAPERPRLQPIPPIQTPVAPASSLPNAIPVNGLVGYVRTPFTNPARLVDVRDKSAGSKVICPYTQRPFLVPASAVAASSPAPTPQPSPAVAQRQAPTPRPQSSSARETTPSIASQPRPQPPTPSVAPAPSPKITPAPATAPKVAAAPPPKDAPAPAPHPTPAPTVAATPPAPNPKPTPSPKQEPPPTVADKPKEPAPAVRHPFGAPIPGRPGFVNSPYAEKHQLVDVTGLSIGTEVKCPYTGKLFRVPPQEQAKK